MKDIFSEFDRDKLPQLIDAIKQNKSVREIVIPYLTPSIERSNDYSRVLSALSYLTHLEKIEINTQLSGDLARSGLALIYNNLQLRSLILRSCDLPADELAEAIYKSNNLTHLQFENMAGSQLIRSMSIYAAESQLPYLMHLSFVACRIGDDTATMLSSIIRGVPLLSHLDLSSNYLASTSIAEIGNALVEHRQLQSLKIRNNSLISGEIEFLTKILEVLPQLSELDIGGYVFSGSDIELFTQMLSKNISLSAIHLTHSEINSAQLDRILNALNARRRYLSNLDLTGNKFGDAGARVLAQNLANNSVYVESLSIGRCDIDTEGLIILCDALKHYRHLRNIDISHNKFSENTVFVKMLRSQMLILDADQHSKNLSNGIKDILSDHKTLVTENSGRIPSLKQLSLFSVAKAPDRVDPTAFEDGLNIVFDRSHS